ncbi:MAG: hypothetical protein HXY38_07805 [Chloroflexi bacterium]|nr:hypothetical protein [Chloroflexota bacterium]
MNKRNTHLFLLVLILASAALALLRFDSLQIGASYDDAKYIILAESLASGQGYELINFPRPQIERNFPPGWPLLLAPFTLVFPKNYDALKIVSLALWLLSISLVYKLFSKRLSSPYLEILTAWVALNPLLIGTSVTLMSESAYLFFSLLALLTFDKTGEKKFDGLILAAVLAFYTQQVRAIGISLTVSLLIILFLSKRFKEMGVVVFLFIVGFALQSGFNLRNGGTVISSGYEAQVLGGSALEKVGQVWSNLIGYTDRVLTGSLIPIFGTRLDEIFDGGFIIVNMLILAVLVTGFFAAKRKLEWMHLYFVIYIAGILAFWNPQVGSVKARFLIPILPFLYFYFLVGAAWLSEKLFEKKPGSAARSVLGLAIVIGLILMARNLLDWRNPIREQITDLSIGASWVAENSPINSIVMVNEPVPAYVHVERKTINFPKNDQDLQAYLDNQGIDYIIISPPLQSPRNNDLDKDVQNILFEILGSPESFALVFEDDANNVRVFEVAP